MAEMMKTERLAGGFIEVGRRKLEVSVCQGVRSLVHTSGSQFAPGRAILSNNSELEIDQFSQD